jgi:hypothetical protein
VFPSFFNVGRSLDEWWYNIIALLERCSDRIGELLAGRRDNSALSTAVTERNNFRRVNSKHHIVIKSQTDSIVTLTSQSSKGEPRDYDVNLRDGTCTCVNCRKRGFVARIVCCLFLQFVVLGVF